MKLEDLLIDEAAIDQAALAEGLAGYVGVTTTGEIRPLEKWTALSERGKVIAGLLSLRAATILGRRPSAAVGPTELAKTTGVAVGTAKRVLRELANDRLVRSDGGTYEVPGVGLRSLLVEMERARA